MTERVLVPLRLHVGLHEETGHAKYPNFNLISSESRKGMDWAKYIDVYGCGMHYDKICTHKDEGHTPYGYQCCGICVPEDFALEALSLFPDTVSRMTANEWATFHDEKAHAHEDDEIMDIKALDGLNSRRSLMVAIGADTTKIDKKIADALNPNIHSEMGVRKNPRKKWADVEAKSGIKIEK